MYYAVILAKLFEIGGFVWFNAHISRIFHSSDLEHQINNIFISGTYSFTKRHKQPEPPKGHDNERKIARFDCLLVFGKINQKSVATKAPAVRWRSADRRGGGSNSWPPDCWTCKASQKWADILVAWREHVLTPRLACLVASCLVFSLLLTL